MDTKIAETVKTLFCEITDETRQTGVIGRPIEASILAALLHSRHIGYERWDNPDGSVMFIITSQTHRGRHFTISGPEFVGSGRIRLTSSSGPCGDVICDTVFVRGSLISADWRPLWFSPDRRPEAELFNQALDEYNATAGGALVAWRGTWFSPEKRKAVGG